MSLIQNNTRSGILPFIAKETLVGKEGYFVEIVNDGGVAKAQLPAAADSVSLYIVEKGTAAGKESDLIPIDPVRNRRAVAKGAGVSGAVLVLAAPGTAADKGKLRTLPAAAGTYFSPGIAEESFADGQNVRFRPFPRLVTVGS